MHEALAIASFTSEDAAELSIETQYAQRASNPRSATIDCLLVCAPTAYSFLRPTANSDLLFILDALSPDGWCTARAALSWAEGLVPKAYVVRLQPQRVTTDFTAEEDDELSASSGELVLVLPRASPDGWVLAKRPGTSTVGLIPANYLADDADLGAEPGVAGNFTAAMDSRPEPALVLSDFIPAESDELQVSAGDLVLLLERPADAPGWTRVLPSDPLIPPGLVPTDYLQFAHGELCAPFEAEDDGELSCDVGARVWLESEQPEGDDGWCSVLSESGGRGLVPQAYVRLYGDGTSPGAQASDGRAASMTSYYAPSPGDV